MADSNRGQEMSNFWRTWLAIFCLSLMIFGVMLSGGAFAATSAPVQFFLTWLGGNPAIIFDPPLRFSLAVLGAVTIGWALTLYAVIVAATDLGPPGRPLWHGIMVAVLVWFVIDCGLSVATGFGRNVIPNLAVLALFLIGVRGSGVMKPTA